MTSRPASWPSTARIMSSWPPKHSLPPSSPVSCPSSLEAKRSNRSSLSNSSRSPSTVSWGNLGDSVMVHYDSTGNYEMSSTSDDDGSCLATPELEALDLLSHLPKDDDFDYNGVQREDKTANFRLSRFTPHLTESNVLRDHDPQSNALIDRPSDRRLSILPPIPKGPISSTDTVISTGTNRSLRSREQRLSSWLEQLEVQMTTEGLAQLSPSVGGDSISSDIQPFYRKPPPRPPPFSIPRGYFQSILTPTLSIDEQMHSEIRTFDEAYSTRLAHCRQNVSVEVTQSNHDDFRGRSRMIHPLVKYNAE